MDLFQFRGGVASYLVSNDQAVTEILDTLGLGLELYINKKKVDMLQNPSAYLQEIKLCLLKALTVNYYASSLDTVAKAVTGKPKIKNDNPEYIKVSLG